MTLFSPASSMSTLLLSLLLLLHPPTATLLPPTLKPEQVSSPIHWAHRQAKAVAPARGSTPPAAIGMESPSRYPASDVECFWLVPSQTKARLLVSSLLAKQTALQGGRGLRAGPWAVPLTPASSPATMPSNFCHSGAVCQRISGGKISRER